MNSTTFGATTPLDTTAATVAFVLEPPSHSGWPAAVLTPGKYIVGSAADCQIRFEAEGIRPHHALLIVSERKTLLKAWDERTWINDWAVSESVVRPGDRISFGPATCRFRTARTDDLLASVLSSPAARPQARREIAAIADAVLPIAAPPVQAASAPPPEPDRNAIRREQEAEARERSLRDWESRLNQRADRLDAERLQLDQRHYQLAEQVGKLSQQADLLAAQTAKLDREWSAREAEWTAAQRRLTEEFAAKERQLEARQREQDRRDAALSAQERSVEESAARWTQVSRDLEQQRADWESASAAQRRQLQAEREGLQAAREQWQREQQEDSARFAAECEALAAERETLAAEREAFTAERQTILDQPQHNDLAEELALRVQWLDQREAAISQQIAELDAARRQLAQDQAASQAAALMAVPQPAFDDLARERAALEQERSALRAEQESLTAQHAALDDREQRLSHQEQHLAAVEQGLREHEQQLSDAVSHFESERSAWKLAAETQESQWQARLQEIAAVEAQRQELQQRQSALADEQARWTDQAERLAAERQELDARRTQLDDVQAELDAERAKLDSERAAANQHLDDLAAEEQRLTELGERLESDRRALAEGKGQLAAAQSELAAAQAEFSTDVTAWSEESEAQRKAFARQQAELDAAQAELAAEREELAAAQRQQQELAEECRNLQAQLAAEYERLQADRAAFEEELGQSAQRQQEWDRKFDELNRQLQELSERESALQEQEHHLAAREQEWEARQSAAAEDNSNAAAEIDRLEQELRRLQEEWNDAAQQRDDLTAAIVELRQQRSDDASRQQAVREELMRRQKELQEEIVRLTDQLHEANSRPQQDQESDAPVEVTGLRAELARLFDLPGDAGSDQAVAEKPVLDDAPVLTDVEEAWQRRLNELQRHSGQTSTAPAESSRRAEPAAASEERDEIASYMERLLSRTRRNSDDPPTEILYPSAGYEADRTVSDTDLPDLADDADRETPTPRSRRSSKPRVAPDKDALREHTEVFRQLANVSARTAVAKHSSRTFVSSLLLRSTIAGLCSVAGVAFFVGWFVYRHQFLPQAVACFIMAAVLGVDFFRSLFAQKRAAPQHKPQAEKMAEPPADEAGL